MKTLTVTWEMVLSYRNTVLQQVSLNFKEFHIYLYHAHNLTFLRHLLFIAAPRRCSVICRCHNNSQLKANILNCSNTRITSLSDLYVPSETNWLISKNNKIKDLQWSDNLRGMTHIDLANSSIDSIGPNFFPKIVNLTKLSYLNLTHNKLKVFDKNISHLRIPEIHLSGNPIECNCDMLWFAEWLNTTLYPAGSRIVKDYEDIKCVGGEWDGEQVYKLTRDIMGCLPTRSIREL